MKKNEQVSIDLNYLTSDLSAALSLQNFDSQYLHFFELRIPFLMILSSCSPVRNNYHFYQFSFEGCFCHILDSKEWSRYHNRPQHQHSFIEIMYVLSGEVTNHIEDKTFTYHAGDCVIMNRNIHHKEEGEYQVVYFDLQEEFINDLISEETSVYKKVSDEYQLFLSSGIVQMLREAHNDNSQYQKIYFDCFPVCPVQDQMQSLLNSMIQELSSADPGSVYLVKGYLQRFLSHLCDPALYNTNGISSTLSKKDFVLTKIQHILLSRHGKVSRSELSEMLHYNEEYLNRIIKQSTGKTFSQYRQYIALQEVRRLLLDTDLSVSRIMEELELSNRSFFYRVFQKEFGLTPSEYRQQRQAAQTPAPH